MMFTDIPLYVTDEQSNNGPTYAVPLSSVVPMVIKSESPMKGMWFES